jgi:exodeoxyribonuclease V beta subunit
MKSLDSVYDLAWSPRIVIEASAGTGKTYTIVGIFIRLLLEKDLKVDQILVMTFTKKATAELRDRILTRLRECLNLIENREVTSDAFLTHFLDWVENRDSEAVKAKIREAIQNFDDSRVFTIHGFCQKVLSEEALSAGVPFDLEVLQHDDLLLQAAEDYWRNLVYHHSGSDAGKYYISKLLQIATTPAELISYSGIGRVIGKPEAEIEAEIISDPVSYLQEVISLRREMAGLWNNENSEIFEILNSCDVSRYSGYLAGRSEKMDRFLKDSTLAEDTPQSLKYFTSEYLYDDQNLKKGGRPTGHHSFFELCTRYMNLTESIDQVKTTIIKDACRTIRKRREELSANSNAITYDDLLIKLRNALSDPERGGTLASKLLNSYPFTLVDEFQDTDSIQYSIFNSIYPVQGEESSLMMIGDPKQAIYAFRGADIYTYFRAKQEGSPHTYSLDKNFRSSPNLIEAVNCLFTGDDRNPFIESEIEFFKSDPGRADTHREYLVSGEPPVPMQITCMQGVSRSKSSVRNFAFNETVKQVSEILEHGDMIINDPKQGGDRIIEAGDIAILVSGHKDASEIKRRLKSVGVDSVTYSQEKVFDSFEASRLRFVMEAVLAPSDRISVNNALLSGLFGIRLHRLYQLKEDESLRQLLTDELYMLQDVWKRDSFMAMFRSLLYKSGRLDEMSVLNNSERILTNLHQLADICSVVEQDSKMDPNALYSWYMREMANPAKDDEQSLLLESDQNLVKISTIHGSKGLEFPVVICPTLWEGRDQAKSDFLSYHKTGSDQVTVNIDQTGTEGRDRAEFKSTIESVAEEVRKMYVALTRAKYECRVIWGTHEMSHFSGLGASVLGREKLSASLDLKVKEDDDDLTDRTFTDFFQKLSDSHPDKILFKVTENADARIAKVNWRRKGPAKLRFSSYSGRNNLPVQKQIESFSSLAGHKSDATEPDYDQVTEWYAEAVSGTQTAQQEKNIFSFPRGATAGTAIHKLFEHEDFHFDRAAFSDHTDIANEILNEYGIDTEWISVVDNMIKDVVTADYGDLDLSSVGSSDHIREMEFNFPISKPDTDRLMRVLREKGKAVSNADTAENYLTGFIDLIVRQNGKYYILDYKSNYLGDNLENYSNLELEEEIKASNYDLQYHLYTVALVRFLKQSLSQFSYEKEFGGVMYLFVRGMRPGSENGIWFHKPDKTVISNLDKILQR